MSRVLVWLVAIAVVLSSARANASNENEADALFAEGQELMKRGRFVEACAKLQKSEELSPGAGTLINLGFCWEQLAKMRSAMEAYAEAEILARGKKDDKNANFAHDRFVAASAAVMKLVLRVADRSIPGLQVTRNGTKVQETDWDKPIPIDPDDIVIVASAPGRVSWRGVVQGRGDAASITVIVPPLEETKEAIAVKSEGLTTRRYAALGLAGASLASIGAGVALALGAKARHDDSAAHCDDAGCDAIGASIQSGAVAQGNVATAIIAIGLMFGGAGAYLWFSGGEAPKKAGFELGPRGIGGRF